MPSIVPGAGSYCGSQWYGDPFFFECASYLLANATDVMQVQIAISLAGCADADKGQIRYSESSEWVGCCAKPASFNCRRDKGADFRFNNRRLSPVYQVNFRLYGVDSHHFMAVVGKTSRRDCPHIPQSEYANSQLLSFRYWSVEVTSVAHELQSIWNGAAEGVTGRS